MQKYKYQAKNKEGRLLKGWVEAINTRNAVAILRNRGLVVIKLVESREDILTQLTSSLRRVSLNDVIDFTRQLATMIGAGLSLIDALENLQEQSRPAMAQILMEVVNDVRGGSTLYEALSKHPAAFSKFYLALVKSGEAAGTLDKVLKKLADNLEKQRRFIMTVRSAMIYPAVIIAAMILVGFLMMILVVPKLLVIYQDMKITLPLPTRILIALTNFLTHFWWLIILGAGGLVYAFSSYYKTSEGRRQLDYYFLRLPLFGSINQKVILTELMRTLAMLVSTGVPIIEALHISAEAATNVVFKEALLEGARDISKGLPLATTFAKYDFFPSVVAQMIAVGEETGRLAEVMEKISANFEEESDLVIKGLTSTIEPILIVILGGAVGFLVMSIIMPIYNLTAQF